MTVNYSFGKIVNPEVDESIQKFYHFIILSYPNSGKKRENLGVYWQLGM